MLRKGWASALLETFLPIALHRDHLQADGNSGLHGPSLAGTEDTWVGLCQWSFFAMEFNIEDYQADSSRVLINTLMNSKVKKNDNLTLSLLHSVNRKVFNSNFFILEPVCQTYILLLCCYRMSTFSIFWSMLFLHLGISTVDLKYLFE